MLYFGTQAFGQNAIVTRIEQSTPAKAADGLQALGRFIPGAGTVGDAVDPRNSQQYAAAKTSLYSDSGLAFVGLLILLRGLWSGGSRAPRRPPAG